MKMRNIIILSLSIFLSFQIYAKEPKTYGTAEVLEVVSVWDGDTFKANLKDLPPIIGERINIRIAKIDTPEKSSSDSKVKKLAYLAKEFVEQKLLNATKVVIENMQRGKYFRIIADVKVDEKDLGEELIGKGLALPYDGGTRPDWTEVLSTKAKK